MRRIACIFLAIAFATMAPCQTWEKLISPGVTYRQDIDASIPRIVHSIRISPNAGSIRLTPELASGVIYREDDVKGRQIVSSLAKRTNALVAINGDYFPFTGDPLGLMVKDSELVSLPYPGRASIAWGPGSWALKICDFEITAQPEGGTPFAITNFNQECGINEISLNTITAGLAQSKADTRVYAVIKSGVDVVPANGIFSGEVQFLLNGTGKVPIQPGNILLAANGNKSDVLRALAPGQKIIFDVKVKGFDWSKMTDAISGGPILLRGGKAILDWKEENFPDAFATKRHPRTAVGLTKQGDVVLVAVDGRQKCSDGATLEELAGVMLRLGCTDALNLDGGGSTTLNVMGLTLNRPSDGVERPVANGLVLTGPFPEKNDVAFHIKAPEKLAVGDLLTLRVMSEKGEFAANSDIIWAAAGPAWIDQGGQLHPFAPGVVTVSALVKGQRCDATVQIAGGRSEQ